MRAREAERASEQVEFSLCNADADVPFLACCFGWFSISLVNYLRLVALVQLLQARSWTSRDVADPANHDVLKKHCAAYVRSAVPEVLAWRHKIAAHFAMTDPRAEDSMATLEATVMNPVSFERPYYWVGAVQWHTGGEGASLPRWALTRVFEDLRPRYWPDVHLPPSGGT